MMAELQCIVVTPEKTVIDKQIEFVALPLHDGEIGIAAKHSPMIGRLGHGEMRLTGGGQSESFYVDGGFVQVNENTVSVLTNRAIPAADLNGEEAQQLLDRANEMSAKSPELMAIRDRLMSQARGQQRMVAKR